MGYIYAICYNNIPIYIGQTIKTVEERWREHLNLAKRQQGYKIHEFLHLHQNDSAITVKILEKTEQLDEKEKYWIKHYHTLYSEQGYNLTCGGQSSANVNKVKCYQYDLNGIFIKEFESISEAARMVNGNHSGICKVLNGELNSAYGFRWSLNKSIQLPPLQTNHTGSSKQIGQYDLDGKLLHIFNSTKEAARFLNKSQGNISSAANGKRKTAYGYKWAFINN